MAPEPLVVNCRPRRPPAPSAEASQSRYDFKPDGEAISVAQTQHGIGTFVSEGSGVLAVFLNQQIGHTPDIDFVHWQNMSQPNDAFCGPLVGQR
jgi:hypothetical protein